MQDLERQVRLRLRNPRVSCNRRQPIATHSYFLKLQRQIKSIKQKGKVKDTQPHYNIMVQHKVPEQYRFEEDEKIVTLRNRPNKLSRERKDVSMPFVDQGNEVYQGNEVVHDNDDEIILPEVLDYVNIKYGTPRAQLKKLTEQGSYETVNVDTSGIGSGPIIKCPVESQVLLPTPYHESSSTVSSLSSDSAKLSTHKRRSSCENAIINKVVTDIASTSSFHSLESRLVYESGQVAFMGGLEFESRFESGNLLKAFQM